MNEYYKLACEYMAKTELFDRGLTSCRSPIDSTEAFIRQPELVKLSYKYSRMLRKEHSKDWHKIKAEIVKHKFYTAQMWVDEYYRLRGEEKHNDRSKN